MSDYSKQWSSAHPGYLIFLIDQSGSMSESFDGNKTRAEFTALVINRTILDIIYANTSGNDVKDRVFISLIGYGGSGGTSVDDIKSGYLSEFANNPIRVEKVKKKVSDGAGGLIDIDEEMPVFLEPVANGLTPMAAAFEFAKDLVNGWISRKPDNPAPVIINISDGAPYTGNSSGNNDDITDTINKANETMNIESSDGNILVFNVHIGDATNKVSFPVDEAELNNNEMAELLFKISSTVPEVYRNAGKKFDLNIQENAKGFIANADGTDLIKFINFGSSGGDFRG